MIGVHPVLHSHKGHCTGHTRRGQPRELMYVCEEQRKAIRGAISCGRVKSKNCFICILSTERNREEGRKHDW